MHFIKLQVDRVNVIDRVDVDFDPRLVGSLRNWHWLPEQFKVKWSLLVV
jgi:hypothetical protein